MLIKIQLEDLDTPDNALSKSAMTLSNSCDPDICIMNYGEGDSLFLRISDIENALLAIKRIGAVKVEKECDEIVRVKLTEEELIKEALNLMGEALCFAYETKTDAGHAFAFLLDNAIKYGQVIMRGDNVLSASADYTAYENSMVTRLSKGD